jgi:hypothetical protein
MGHMMGLFDRLFGAKEKVLAALAAAPTDWVKEPPAPTDWVKEPPATREKKVKEEPKTAKQIATDKKEPYVNIVSLDVDLDNLHQGAFELDWNEIFVARLVKAGYMIKKDDTDAEIVDRWFQNVCRHVVMETWEQEEAIAKSGMWVRSTDVGNGRSEVS